MITVLPLQRWMACNKLLLDRRKHILAGQMGRRMAQGTLAGTVYKDDKECIDWFVETFEKWLSSELNPKMCSEMLKAPAANKWRQVETQTVVKDWMFGLLENCPQDFRDIYIHRDQTL